MVYPAGIEPMPNMLSFMNGVSTGHVTARARMDQVQEHLTTPAADVKVIGHIAMPQDVLLVSSEGTLVYSDGGDGTVRKVIAAMAGIVPDDPEATARHFADHHSLAPTLRYFAGAGGNANNWPLSAHGRFAARPERLAEARMRVGLHRPLIYEVVDEQGNVVRSNIATSCIGVGAAATVAHSLDQAKPELGTMSRSRRLVSEMVIAFHGVWEAPAFSVAISTTSGDTLVSQSDVTGFELIKSRLYAKQGKTQVNVDDNYWQPVVSRRSPGMAKNALLFAETLLRLKLGRHVLAPEDFSGQGVMVRLLGDTPVRYHADGETDERSVVLPGQTLRMRLARIAIPTLITVPQRQRRG